MEHYCEICSNTKESSSEIGYDDIYWCDDCIEKLSENGHIFYCEVCNKYWNNEDKYECEDISICMSCHERNEESINYSRGYYADNDEGDDILHD